MAFCYFLEEKVDFAVLEVGLGGRLDATNIVNAEIAVITTIDFDHMKQLGNSLTEISREKAGIIKENAIVITGASGEALVEIENIAKKQKAGLIIYPRDIAYQNLELNRESNVPKYQEFTISGRLGKYKNLKTKLLGEHQLMNATLSVGAVETLLEKYFCNSLIERKKILEKGIPEGIYNTTWNGRLEMIEKSPIVLLDGAHNPSGASVLQKALHDIFVFKSCMKP